jgi:CHAD domain-containing protein
METFPFLFIIFFFKEMDYSNENRGIGARLGEIRDMDVLTRLA